jgi:hypothetical protein
MNSAMRPDAPPVGSGAGNPPGTETLPAMLRAYGEKWEVRRDGRGGWVAIERLPPIEPPQPKVLTAADLGELRQQLENLNGG